MVGWLVSVFYVYNSLCAPLSSLIICCLLFKLCFDGRFINLIMSFSGVEDQQGVNLQQSPAIQHAIAAAVTVL